MKVSVTSIAPVGFIEIYEDGSYQTGDFSVDGQTSALRAPSLDGKYEVVPLGVLLPLVDLEHLTQVDETRLHRSATFDERVPDLLKKLCAGPGTEHEELMHALLLDGYWEQIAPNGRSTTRRVFRSLENPNAEDRHISLRLEETNAHSIPVWTGHAEVSLGRRGFFRMELYPLKVDSDQASHVKMLNLFVTDLARFARAWGDRLAADIDARPFNIFIDRTWVERRGIAEKHCVAFHLDHGVDQSLLERAIERVEPDATLETYDAEAKSGAWYLVDIESEYRLGDVIEA